MRNISSKVYLIFFILLALFVNNDILFNGYNYGRHWDWTFYPHADFFKNYLTSFFYSLKPNSLTYFDVVSTPLSEVVLKGLIYAVFQLGQLLKLSQLTIPILNKLFVFILIPTFTSIGIWNLSNKILKKVRDENEFTFFIITVFCNLLYTFSLILLYDAHGGALNRLISGCIIPWFYFFYYQYIVDSSSNRSTRNIYALVLICLFFDLANIFFFSTLVCLAILFKKNESRVKVIHFLQFFFLSLLTNIYWLHPFILNNVVNLQTILTERKTDLVPLQSYSSKYFELFFPFNFPHNLIRRAFHDSFLIYLPYFGFFLLIFHNFHKAYAKIKNQTILKIVSLGFFVITLLVSGYYNITQLQHVIYQIPLLSFTKGAQRYVSVMISFFIFFFLVAKSLNPKSVRVEKYTYLLICVFYLAFLCMYTPIVTKIVKNVIPKGYLNQDVGSLYEFDATNYVKTKQDTDYYNILPIPSWFSPYFTQNIYPRTSQGSNTDTIFFGKGMLYTNGVSLFSSSFFDSFVKNPNPLLYGIANIRYIMFSPMISQLSNKDHTFTYDWVSQSLPTEQEGLKKAYEGNILYKVPDEYYYPQVYAPTTIYLASESQKEIGRFITESQLNTSVAVVPTRPSKDVENKVKETNANNHNVEIDFRRISPSQYLISTQQTNTPYFLVLSTAFYEGWKLTPIDPQQDKSSGISSNKRIHGSKYNEHLHNSSFSMFNKPLEESHHISVNGYANAWYINPQDLCDTTHMCDKTNGKIKMSFIAEFVPQRGYAFTLFITCLTVLFVLANIMRLKHKS